MLTFFGCSGVLECSGVPGCSGVPDFSTCRNELVSERHNLYNLVPRVYSAFKMAAESCHLKSGVDPGNEVAICNLMMKKGCAFRNIWTK